MCYRRLVQSLACVKIVEHKMLCLGQVVDHLAPEMTDGDVSFLNA